ncbi:MAG: DUF433 domain-containing protein [Chloroflexi bacterium]|nr:DUF433 domain-containing protein [Chloroflexota bacterium]
MSAAPVFRCTRVPVQTLFDYIAGGSTLDEFLDNFPNVARARMRYGSLNIGQLSGAGTSSS